MTRHLFLLVASLNLGMGLLGSGCASAPTTPSEKHMSEANTLLKQASQLAKSGDFGASRILAPALSAEVRQGVETAPRVNGDGEPLPDLESLLSAWESGSYQAWLSAVEAGDRKAARQSLVAMKAQCGACHAAIGRPMIHVVGVR